MNNILVQALNNTFRLVQANNESKKELYVLLENNREDLFNLQLDVSLIESEESFNQMIDNAKVFNLVYKNDNLIGCIYIDQWGNFDEIHFWLDKENRDNKIFTEIVSLFIKSYVNDTNIDVLTWAIRGKAVASKAMAKKIGFKSIFRYNSKINEFDQKKVIPATMFVKTLNKEMGMLLNVNSEFDNNVQNELETFCKDLSDYEFKRNNFFVEINNTFYYWSGNDVTDDLKELTFINFAKSKAIYKKIAKKLNVVEEYKELLNNAKKIHLIYHRNLNSVSVLFINANKQTNWIHFDNAII